MTGMLAWGTVAGLLGSYGNAGAAMGLPVVWTYLELGLTTPVHTPSHAFALAALYTVGGVWAVMLASLINVIGPYGPLRERAAECYGRNRPDHDQGERGARQGSWRFVLN